jgi:hypothetical protein
VQGGGQRLQSLEGILVAMRISNLLLVGSLTLLLSGILPAQDSQPAAKAKPTLKQVLAAAQKAGAIKDGKHHTYFRGQDPSVALVEHEATLAKGTLTSVFTEHGSGGSFVRSSYQLDAEGLLQEVKIERGTRDSYPEATETQTYRREKDELVEQVKEGKKAERSSLPKNAIPMSLVTFFLPRISGHVNGLVFTPLFEAQVYSRTMSLGTLATKAGSQVEVLIDAQAAVTIYVDHERRITRLQVPAGSGVKRLSTEEAEAALAKLRPA